MTTTSQYELNKGLAQMLKGGVIMDVTTPEQAKIAEAAGACAVMALERIPADISAVSVILLKPRFYRLLRLIILMNQKYFLLLMTFIILIRHSSMYHLYAVQGT